MPEATPDTKDYPVIGHFRRKERDVKGIDRSVSYAPGGDCDPLEDGWPGAKSVFTGVPGSPEVQELFDGAGGDKGPLIREPDEEKPDEEKADDGTAETAAPEGDDSKSKTASRRTAPKSTTTEEG